jgi:hypothetical protein
MVNERERLAMMENETDQLATRITSLPNEVQRLQLQQKTLEAAKLRDGIHDRCIFLK